MNFDFYLLSLSFEICRSILDTVSETFWGQYLKILKQFWARFVETLVVIFCENFRDNFGDNFVNNFVDKFENIMTNYFLLHSFLISPAVLL